MTCFIVLESVSHWPDWVAGRCHSSSWRVVEQRDGETPSELALRIADLVRNEPSALQLGVIACNERSDDAADGSRRDMVQALLARLTTSGRVVLTASDRASGESRRRLSELAQSLNSHCDGTERSVTVRFGHPAEELPSEARLG
jgi:hypothetical protein